MPALPLYYHRALVGHALVDPELHSLPPQLKWTLSLPPSLQRDYRGRPDVLLAMLREDPSTLQRCTPTATLFVAKHTLIVRLARLALRPQCVELVQRVVHSRENLLHDISTLTSQIHRVVHLDANKCNCQAANLREIAAYTTLLED